jgi:preprotein translocase subunit SecG
VIYLTVIAGLLAVIVCLVAALLLERKAMAELLAHFEVMHQEERARFLAAVQRPDQIQPVHPRSR